MGTGEGIGEELAFLILVAGVVAVIVLVAWWVFAIVCISGALLGWLWGMWKGDGPGEVERAWRRRCAPLWHYPFIGAGSVIASLASAVAVHEIVRGAEPALPVLVLFGVLARSLSMAWFPRPGAQLVGLRVFPRVAVTGPLSSALGMLAVWVLVLGGQTVGHVHDHWLAMTSVSGAIAITLLATGVGRLGRTLVPTSARFRADILALLAPEAVAIGRDLALWRNPHQSGLVAPSAAEDPSEAPGRSPCLHGDRFIPPMGPPEAPWAAFRPPVRLNWRRCTGMVRRWPSRWVSWWRSGCGWSWSSGHCSAPSYIWMGIGWGRRGCGAGAVWPEPIWAWWYGRLAGSSLRQWIPVLLGDPVGPGGSVCGCAGAGSNWQRLSARFRRSTTASGGMALTEI